MKTTAEKYGVPVFQFEKIRKDGVETLKNLNADVMVTCAYGQLLSQEIIDLFPYGVINIHASLLPLYRGAAPIQYAVVDGARETGVTLMQTDIGLDTGDIISVYKTNIGEDETAGELAERLSVIGASMQSQTGRKQGFYRTPYKKRTSRNKFRTARRVGKKFHTRYESVADRVYLSQR